MMRPTPWGITRMASWSLAPTTEQGNAQGGWDDQQVGGPGGGRTLGDLQGGVLEPGTSNTGSKVTLKGGWEDPVVSVGYGVLEPASCSRTRE